MMPYGLTLVRCFQFTAHVFVLSCMSILKGLAPFGQSRIRRNRKGNLRTALHREGDLAVPENR